jgi:hypothetical protein
VGNVLLVAGVLAALFVVGVITVTWIVWGRIRRRNEVSASHPIRPPLRWLASPEPCGRLHRRLRDAVLVLRRAVPARRGWRRRDKTAVEALATAVEAHAVSLDLELLIAARTRGHDGVAARTRLAAEIAQLEHAAHRLAALSLRSTSRTSESTEVALGHIAEELDAREAAWTELSAIERDAGLRLPV